jgi:hypothetical protein
MGEFRHNVEEPERMTANAVLDGVSRMLSRIRLQEAPRDAAEARVWRLALRVADNALRRGEWER